MPVSKKLARAYLVLTALTLCLIALGGGVRAMNAGLACPDWPLCFGRFIPDYHPQVYFEFIHRVIAGTIGLVTVALHVLLWRRLPLALRGLKSVICLSLALLCAQVIMGGLTVLKLLAPLTVTTHLALGISFYLTLLWISFRINPNLFVRPSLLKAGWQPNYMFGFFAVLALAVFAQILLGGRVAANYAGLVCTDFPLCNGQLVPSLEGALGIHVTHRLGAYLVAFLVLAAYAISHWRYQRAREDLRVLLACRALLTLVLLQMALGLANIKFSLPPLLTVFHLVFGVLILSLAIYIIFVYKRLSET